MRKYVTRPPEERFWAKVDKSGDCWLWTASTHDGEYGGFAADSTGRTVAAHRFSYELSHGPIPSGMKVMHSCDTPRCVNPGHLSLGTNLDNVRDMVAKRRHSHGDRHYSRAKPWTVRRGERNSNHKLSFAQVTNIRIMCALGAGQYDLAEWFNVHQTNISWLKLNKGRVSE